MAKAATSPNCKQSSRVLRRTRRRRRAGRRVRPYLTETRAGQIDTGRGYYQRVASPTTDTRSTGTPADSAADISSSRPSDRQPGKAWASLRTEAHPALAPARRGGDAGPRSPVMGTTPRNGVSSRAVRAKRGCARHSCSNTSDGRHPRRARDAAARRRVSAQRTSNREHGRGEVHLKDCKRCKAVVAEITDVNSHEGAGGPGNPGRAGRRAYCKGRRLDRLHLVGLGSAQDGAPGRARRGGHVVAVAGIADGLVAANQGAESKRPRPPQKPAGAGRAAATGALARHRSAEARAPSDPSCRRRRLQQRRRPHSESD